MCIYINTEYWPEYSFNATFCGLKTCFCHELLNGNNYVKKVQDVLHFELLDLDIEYPESERFLSANKAEGSHPPHVESHLPKPVKNSLNH